MPTSGMFRPGIDTDFRIVRHLPPATVVPTPPTLPLDRPDARNSINGVDRISCSVYPSVFREHRIDPREVTIQSRDTLQVQRIGKDPVAFLLGLFFLPWDLTSRWCNVGQSDQIQFGLDDSTKVLQCPSFINTEFPRLAIDQTERAHQAIGRRRRSGWPA